MRNLENVVFGEDSWVMDESNHFFNKRGVMKYKNAMNFESE